jgi:hypothetical protein
MSKFKVGDLVTVARISNDPYGDFTKAVLGKTGAVASKPAQDSFYFVDLPDEGLLVFREAELKAAA